MRKSEESRTTVSLVLASGGARGLAHIGVIHELEARGIEIASISGCSIGALIGGVYAAGKLNEFEHWVRAITKMDMVNLMDLSWARHGLGRNLYAKTGGTVDLRSLANLLRAARRVYLGKKESSSLQFLPPLNP